MTIKRVWQYTKKYKKLLTFSMFALIFSIVLDLAIPYLASRIIDDYIVGIEKPWYRVDENVENSVLYDGNYYIQGRFAKDKSMLDDDERVSILLIKNKFYFSDKFIVEGEKRFAKDNSKLWVTLKDGETIEYDLTLLTAGSIQVLSPLCKTCCDNRCYLCDHQCVFHIINLPLSH